MLVFPQLSTGASTLYPVIKTVRQRCVVNTLGDGRTDLFADPAAASQGWQLHATGLTLNEWTAIEALFQATGGMWQPFTFLDPVGNLIAESESFGSPGWTNGPLINLTAGVADPFGTTRATHVVNAGQAAEAVAQALPVPGNFHYCLTVWARTDSGTSITLSISTTGGSVSKTFIVSTQWVRLSFAANLAQTTATVTFGAQLGAGGTIDLFGMQVEAQPGASDYKQTGVRGGIYTGARFGTDKITVTAQGPDLYDAVLQIVNTENE